ncbi:S8 family serine peptidase [Caulobacter hibisci]|uniref:S8 family serine peptidase n=1 Tax=Caulobacter hibisci TaxID=2035993 RepID=A0ABS0SS35_9CAUL|nr:S8 family serine peptidase [Caulobacter hibisci]MBI1682299.1 S8 family serine peptidase [Caulobacter hibisci]
MATDRSPAVLIKAQPLKAQSLRLAGGLGAAPVRLKAEPLFENIEPQSSGDLGVTGEAGAGAEWQKLTLEQGDDRSLWDLCHALASQGGTGLGAAGDAGVAFAEPDLEQQWTYPAPPPQFGAAAPACRPQPTPQRRNFPHIDGDNLWFRNGAHSGFGETHQTGAGARIAHIDTGYDPTHQALPKHLRLDLQRNFVDRGHPGDASDRSEGLFVQDGHGMGTIGILASAQYGGAPGAEVVPIRIADRVVLFRSSTFAKALDYVYGLRGDPRTRIDVITMSMGGLASQAWAEAVNRLYEAGVFIVTAAGNNENGFPTRNVVYPARFNRVVAACGVMADGSAYADLGPGRMAGNYGPDSKMVAALSACTPNLPWAVGGCEGLVDWSGQGTSCATPQVAAAAALWIAENRAKVDAYPEGWMRVEAVRKALFSSARPGARSTFGAGLLRADKALGIKPAAANTLRKSPEDDAAFALIRLAAGLGAAGLPRLSPAEQRMLELEILQLSQSAAIEAIMPDPEDPPETETGRRKLREALADQPNASRRLKSFLRADRTVQPPAKPAAPPPPSASRGDMDQLHLEHAKAPTVREPPARRLRVYAFDPSFSASQDTAAINVARLEVPWDANLKPGPVGEYLEVIDIDPVSDAAYAPVDLNHPHLLSQDGLSPTPADPRFHQQMVYAVAMKTIGHFERALGRTAQWASRRLSEGDKPTETVGDDPGKPAKRRDREEYVQRLRIYPHAFRGANAYYSPDRKALLFGYFPAAGGDWRDTPAGQMTFSCLSHDIVAHETSHALLDGLHPRYRESTHPDAMALHEAFSDIVALFQHFTLPEALEHQIARSRGDLAGGGPLVQLAVEFGRANSREGQFQKALREAVDNLSQEKLTQLQGVAPELPMEAHDRGAMLVASVFDAFLTLYAARQEELVVLATGGSGVLSEGRLPQPLVKALARAASKLAGQLLTICIRALDYCPPVDATFGDYLRAIITADRDVAPNDVRGYRLALIGGFAKRGIFPQNVPHLSPGSLVWEAPPPVITTAAKLLPRLDLGWNLRNKRRQSWELSRQNARELHAWLSGRRWDGGAWVALPADEQATDLELKAFGLYREPGPRTIDYVENGETFHEEVEIGKIEVHSVRPARRTGPDGVTVSDIVVEITQKWTDSGGITRRGGCTVLFDLESYQARYLIRKRVANLAQAWAETAAAPPPRSPGKARSAYFGVMGAREPFAMLHDCC